MVYTVYAAYSKSWKLKIAFKLHAHFIQSFTCTYIQICSIKMPNAIDLCMFYNQLWCTKFEYRGTDVCLIFQEDINNCSYDALVNSKDIYIIANTISKKCCSDEISSKKLENV